MARAQWKGSISFGLVSIPVELHTAVRDHRPRFRLLHAEDRSPIKLQRVCQREGQPVGWDDLVKGYEYEKGRFVVLGKEDFEAAALEKSRTIDILDFVEASELDLRFLETSYYLAPGKGGDRAYALLREAMRQTGRVGIAKIILREAQHLVAVSVMDKALLLTMMRFADEVVDPASFNFPASGEIRKPELEMARTLVESLGDQWSPDKYTDEYRANLMRIIAAKAKGKRPRLEAEEEPRHAEVVDLMERLRRSLNARGAQSAKGGRTAKREVQQTQRGRKKKSSRPARRKRTTAA
jgi:DNA end-binding protein Ku